MALIAQIRECNLYTIGLSKSPTFGRRSDQRRVAPRLWLRAITSCRIRLLGMWLELCRAALGYGKGRVRIVTIIDLSVTTTA